MTLINIRAKTRFLLGELTSTQYSDANLNTNINQWYQQAIEEAVLSSGDWEINGEVATTDLVIDQKEYVFPTDLIQIKRIEINYDGSANGWWKVEHVDMREIGSALSNTDVFLGKNYVRVFDNSLILLVNPVTAVTAGIKIYYSTEPTALSADDDTPNLPELAVPYLYNGAALDYAVRADSSSDINKFSSLLEGSKQALKKHYSNRQQIGNPKIKRAYQAFA